MKNFLEDPHLANALWLASSLGVSLVLLVLLGAATVRGSLTITTTDFKEGWFEVLLCAAVSVVTLKKLFEEVNEVGSEVDV